MGAGGSAWPEWSRVPDTALVMDGDLSDWSEHVAAASTCSSTYHHDTCAMEARLLTRLAP